MDGPAEISITETQFGLWRNREDTRFFLAAVRAWIAEIEEGHAARWRDNVTRGDVEVFEAGRRAALAEILEMRYNAAVALLRGFEDAATTANDDKGEVRPGAV